MLDLNVRRENGTLAGSFRTGAARPVCAVALRGLTLVAALLSYAFAENFTRR